MNSNYFHGDDSFHAYTPLSHLLPAPVCVLNISNGCNDRSVTHYGIDTVSRNYETNIRQWNATETYWWESNICSGKGLLPLRQKTIYWTNINQAPWHDVLPQDL